MEAEIYCSLIRLMLSLFETPAVFVFKIRLVPPGPHVLTLLSPLSLPIPQLHKPTWLGNMESL